MTIESKARSVSRGEKSEKEIPNLINQYVDQFLDLPEEKRKVISIFLLWMANPSAEDLSRRNLTTVQKTVYSDQKLELAVDFIGSRLALQSQSFAEVFEKVKPSPALPPESKVRKIKKLYDQGANAQIISGETGLSSKNVYSVIIQLKRNGRVQPRTEQFGYAKINERDLDIAVDWNNDLLQKEIRANHNLTNGELTGISKKLIELGLVERRSHHQTKLQKRTLDTKVKSLRVEGKGRREIADFLQTTEGVVQSSIRRLTKNGEVAKKSRRYSNEDWDLLTVVISHLRFLGFAWKEIESKLKISVHRSHIIRQRLKGKV